MSDFYHSLILAKAIHAALSSNTAVKSVLGESPRLYDAAPQDPIYPYLTYGPMRSEDIGGDNSPLFAHAVSLHIWSRYRGRAEVMTCVSAVAGALEGTNLQLSGAHLVSANTVYIDSFRAPDGRTLHGLIRMKITTQPLTETP